MRTGTGTIASSAWVFNNLWKRWSSVARRHAATKASASATLLGQLSGYGANPQLVNRVLDRMAVRCVALRCARGLRPST